MQVLVTGAAGFIGSHLTEALLARGDTVVGLDAFIDYYPASVKRTNIEAALADPGFRLVEADLRTSDLTSAVEGCDAVVHAAAMPGLPRSDRLRAVLLVQPHRHAAAGRGVPHGRGRQAPAHLDLFGLRAERHR